jgi:hypothetical protein
MAKNVSGDLQVMTANRLFDGAVVFLDAQGWWSADLGCASIAADKAAAERLVEAGRLAAEANVVVDPQLIAVTDEDGAIEPVSLRERIRAHGLTFDAIAADAVRWM